MDILCNELIYYISEYCDLKSKVNLKLTCHLFNDVIDTKITDNTIITKDFLETPRTIELLKEYFCNRFVVHGVEKLYVVCYIGCRVCGCTRHANVLFDETFLCGRIIGAKYKTEAIIRLYNVQSSDPFDRILDRMSDWYGDKNLRVYDMVTDFIQHHFDNEWIWLIELDKNHKEIKDGYFDGYYVN